MKKRVFSANVRSSVRKMICRKIVLCGVIFFIAADLFAEPAHLPVQLEPRVTIYLVSENPESFRAVKHNWQARLVPAQIELLSTQKYYEKFQKGVMLNANHFIVAQGYQGEFFFTSELDATFSPVKATRIQAAITEYRLREAELRQDAGTLLEKAIECVRSGERLRAIAFLRRIDPLALLAAHRATYYRLKMQNDLYDGSGK